MGNLFRVCSASDLPDGDKMVVEVLGEAVLVVNHQGKIYAVSAICTHEYAELVNGFVIDKTITCPVHLSRFRLDSGEVLNPPAHKALKTYHVHVVDGEIFVEV